MTVFSSPAPPVWMDWLGLHVILFTLHDHLLERLGSDSNTQELNHEGLAIKSCLLVNCFYGFSLYRLVIAHVRCVSIDVAWRIWRRWRGTHRTDKHSFLKNCIDYIYDRVAAVTLTFTLGQPVFVESTFRWFYKSLPLGNQTACPSRPIPIPRSPSVTPLIVVPVRLLSPSLVFFFNCSSRAGGNKKKRSFLMNTKASTASIRSSIERSFIVEPLSLAPV
jgi:hypothetical protein